MGVAMLVPLISTTDTRVANARGVVPEVGGSTPGPGGARDFSRRDEVGFDTTVARGSEGRERRDGSTRRGETRAGANDTRARRKSARGRPGVAGSIPADGERARPRRVQRRAHLATRRQRCRCRRDTNALLPRTRVAERVRAVRAVRAAAPISHLEETALAIVGDDHPPRRPRFARVAPWSRRDTRLSRRASPRGGTARPITSRTRSAGPPRRARRAPPWPGHSKATSRAHIREIYPRRDQHRARHAGARIAVGGWRAGARITVGGWHAGA